VGCGGSGLEHSHTRPERPQPPASLPAGWHQYRDYASGLSVGVPPGWNAVRRRDSLRITSPDGLVAVSITADRTSDAVSVPPDRLARVTVSNLPGYRGGLGGGKPVQVGGTPLQAAALQSTGVTSSGARQRVTLVVLRRPHLVNYTLVAAVDGNAPATEATEGVAVARTVRDIPVAPNSP
jgi:hypothetical protein